MNPFRLILLFPFVALYGIVTWIRNKFFDWGIFSSISFDFPVISVGNLTTGGTGKTPHVEYLVRLLKDNYKVAILSRGYKRKTNGFLMAGESTGADKIGDEPRQFKSKFSEITVAVDEKRVRGIKELRRLLPETEIILLDDAFQHRWVRPGLSILLTDYHKLYSNDWPLPAGSLREFRKGAERADIIVVTKNSKILSPITRRELTNKLRPGTHQSTYFSYVEHGRFKKIPGIECVNINKNRFNTILLVSGIANPYPLEFHLKSYCDELETLLFPDHHYYTSENVVQIIEKFDNIVTRNKIIVTTEKDSTRLSNPEFLKLLKGYPICYVPIEVVFYKEDKPAFEKQILEYVRKNSGNNKLYQEQN